MSSTALGLTIIAALVLLVLLGGSSPLQLKFLSRGPLATGPGTDAEIQNPQPVVPETLQTPQDSETKKTKPGYSPYEGMVRITHVERSAKNPHEEYITLRSGGFFRGSAPRPAKINVTRWSIENNRGRKGTIPRAYEIPNIDADPRDVLLSDGGELIIVTGSHNFGRNFRENACIGYLNESYSFIPSLSNFCKDHELKNRSLLLDKKLSGKCIEFIEQIPSCRIPKIGFEESGIGNECVEFIAKNFSYVGCVANFRDTKDFFKDTWRVFLDQPQKLFDPLHDKIILRDEKGLIVDQFEY